MSKNQAKTDDEAFAQQIQEQPHIKCNPSDNYKNAQNYPPIYPDLDPYFSQSYKSFSSHGRPYYPPTGPMDLIWQQPTVIVINQDQNYRICPYCHTNAPIIQKDISGCATWGWCTFLLLFTGICCWIPFVMDDCYDMKYICANCKRVRGYVYSPYGC